jgi:CheY-like chemotaxis protein
VSLPSQDILVAFIDDDLAILEAMVELFDQWGIPLAVGEDAEQVRRELEDLGQHPSLILSDYRLREGRTGIEAIALLRAAFGSDIPAAVLTGDTGADTIAALNASGLAVLHKPFKPAKLRAFLNHLLADKTGTPPPA